MAGDRLAAGDKTGTELVLLCTRFPHPTETFLQREVLALREAGIRLRMVSLWGGGHEFGGTPVDCFNGWRLFTVLWRLPLETVRTRGGLLTDACRVAFRRPPANWGNFWENLLGAGYGIAEADHYRRARPAQTHAVWASAPAAAAWTLWRLTGIPYSMAAHAYDIYEHGGDWLLPEKAELARFVRTSTAMAAATLRERGVAAAKVLLVRRGLESLPSCKPLRRGRSALRIICVARLVEKKGLERQLELHAAARAAGLECEVRIYGEGPLRARLETRIRQLALEQVVTLMGHQPADAIFRALEWADVLVHTGVVARSGDRDGLPNVIPEAMAAGTLVVTSPAAATTEAITHERTGLVVALEDEAGWCDAWRRMMADDVFCEQLRSNARDWVEQNFDVHRNMAVLWDRLRAAAS